MQKLRTIYIIIFAWLSCTATLFAQNDRVKAQAENRFVNAVSSFVAGDTDGAMAVFKDLTVKNPTMDAAWYYLGLCQMSKRQIGPAIASIRKAVGLSPDNYWYRDRLALFVFYFGSKTEAIEIYEKMRQDFPKDTQIPYTLANVYIQSGLLEDAVKVMDDIDREFGRSEGVTRTRYSLLMQLDREADALAALKEYNDEYSSPEILAMMGEHYAMNSDYESSVGSFKEALSLQSDFLPALGGLADTYRSFGKDDEFFSTAERIVTDEAFPPAARKGFLEDLMEKERYYVSRNLARVDTLMTRALEASPSDTSVARTVGMYFIRSGKPERATDVFKSIAEQYPKDSAAVSTYLEVLLYQEQWKEASDAAGEAFRLMPESHWLLELKNYADYSLKDYDALIRNAEIMLKSPSAEDRVKAYSSIGDIYHEKGDDAKAFDAYDKALKLDPDYVPVLNNYAYYLSVKGKNLKKAYNMAKKCVAAYPDNATYLDTFAWILHLQGKDIEAKPQFKHAMLYGGKDNAVILDHYAEVLYALKEYEMASIYWKQAIQKNNGEIPGLEEKVAARLAAVGL